MLAQRNATTWINTGGFMANFILRFAPGNQKFQPYAGAGVGIYYAESAGAQLTNPNTGTVTATLAGGEITRTSRGRLLPAQIIIGPPSSARLLNTSSRGPDTQIDTRQSRVLGQQLVGAGVRFHF